MLETELKTKAERDTAEAAAAKQAAAAAKAVEDADTGVLDALAGAGAVGAALLARVCNHVKLRTDATDVYIARREAYAAKPDDPEPEDDELGERAWQVAYMGTSDGAEWLRDCALIEGQGVTFRAWVEPEPAEDEEEEDEDEDEDEEGRAPKPLPELPTIAVESVLHEPAVVCHGLPRLGGFIAVPVRFSSALHSEALPDDALQPPAREEEEEEADAADDAGSDAEESKEAEPKEWPVPPPQVQEVRIALCMDTLGQNRAVPAASEATLKRYAEALAEALTRTELAAYNASVPVLRSAAAAAAALAPEWELKRGEAQEAAAAAVEADTAAAEEALAQESAAMEAALAGAQDAEGKEGDAAPELPTPSRAWLLTEEAPELASEEHVSALAEARAAVEEARTALAEARTAWATAANVLAWEELPAIWAGVADVALPPAPAVATVLQLALRAVSGAEQPGTVEHGRRAGTWDWGVAHGQVDGLLQRVAQLKPAADMGKYPALAISGADVKESLEGTERETVAEANLAVAAVFDALQAAANVQEAHLAFEAAANAAVAALSDAKQAAAEAAAAAAAAEAAAEAEEGEEEED